MLLSDGVSLSVTLTIYREVSSFSCQVFSGIIDYPYLPLDFQLFLNIWHILLLLQSTHCDLRYLARHMFQFFPCALRLDNGIPKKYYLVC